MGTPYPEVVEELDGLERELATSCADGPTASAPKRMKDDGSLNALIRKWFGPEAPPFWAQRRAGTRLWRPSLDSPRSAVVIGWQRRTAGEISFSNLPMGVPLE